MFEEINNEKKLRLIKMGIIVIPIFVVAIILLIIFTKNEYSTIEKEIVKKAKDYISSNGIVVDNQTYLNIEKLGVDEGAELCSKASGVIITNVSGKIKYNPYLKCVDYESDIISNSQKYIELNGSEVVLVNKGSMYFDEGYTKKKDVQVEKIGNVYNDVGAYTINYVVKIDGKQKAIVKRIVIVSDVNTNITISGLKNKEEPIITLKGEPEVYLRLNQKYSEAGYLAYDYKDGKISRKVKVNDNIDISKVGTYEVNYEITNSKGKEYSIKRIVHVAEKIADLNITLTQTDNGATTNESKININVSGEGYTKMYLPDGDSTTFSYASYTAKSNGIYTFKVQDQYGNIINKSIQIDNIDNVAPTGSCVVEVLSGKSTIVVTASDDQGIGAVNYVINGQESGFLATTQYVALESLASARVILRDIAGNTTNVSCSVENKKVYTFNYVKYSELSTKPVIKCKSYTAEDRTRLEALLSTAVDQAGYGTRAGVVEAARFLVGGLDYTIPYQGTKDKEVDPDAIIGRYGKGLNIGKSQAWGCSINGWTQGMDCTNFVSWAFKNGGVTMKGGIYSTSNTHKSAEVADQIQVGDFMLSPCGNSCKHESIYSHIGIVIGVDATTIYVAEANDNGGINVKEWEKSNMPKSGKFSVVRFYPYEQDGNVTNMWN